MSWLGGGLTFGAQVFEAVLAGVTCSPFLVQPAEADRKELEQAGSLVDESGWSTTRPPWMRFAYMQRRSSPTWVVPRGTRWVSLTEGSEFCVILPLGKWRTCQRNVTHNLSVFKDTRD